MHGLFYPLVAIGFTNRIQNINLLIFYIGGKTTVHTQKVFKNQIIHVVFQNKEEKTFWTLLINIGQEEHNYC